MLDQQRALDRRASMALSGFPGYLQLLLLCATATSAAVDRRFSDFKRCADDECSMLLCRGKAAQDFTGPDCRFLPFKKGETVYVYYKLAGKRSDLWAGSVGSAFGYFPKDLLTVNHIYTEKEVEVTTEETDFVCFDTGFNTFEDYDVDSLLAAVMLPTESENSAAKASNDVDPGKDGEIHSGSREQAPVESSPVDQDHTSDTDSQSLNDDPIKDFESERIAEDITEEKYLGDLSPEVSIHLLKEMPAETLEAYELDHVRQTGAQDEGTNNGLHKDQSVGSSVLDSVHPVENKTIFAPPEVDQDHTSDTDSQSLNDNPIKDFESERIAEDITEEKYLGDLSPEVSIHLLKEMPAETLEANELDHVRQTGAQDEGTNNGLHKDQSVGSSVLDSVHPVENKTIFAPPEVQDQSLTTADVNIETESHFSEGKIVPELKTTFGSTFDAVTSDDEDTWRITPNYDEKENKESEDQLDDAGDSEEIPLLAFTENKTSQPDRDILQASHLEEDNDFNTDQSENQNRDIKDERMSTSLGDTDFAIVSGDESTNQVTSLEREVEDNVDVKEFHKSVPEKPDSGEEQHAPLFDSDSHQEPKEMAHSEGQSKDAIFEENVGSNDNDVNNLSDADLPENLPDGKTGEDLSDESRLKGVENDNRTIESELSTVDAENKESLDIFEDVSIEKVTEHSLSELSDEHGTLEAETGETSNDTQEYIDASKEENASLEVTAVEPSAFPGVKSLENTYTNAAEASKDTAPDVAVTAQVDRVKKEVMDLFTQTLEKENLSRKEAEIENHDVSVHLDLEEAEQEVMLLEDENALLSKASKEELATKEHDLASKEDDSNDLDPDSLQRENEREGVEIHTSPEVQNLEDSLAVRDVEATAGTDMENKSSQVSHAPEDINIEKKIDLASSEFDQINVLSESESEHKDVDSETVLETEIKYDECVQQLFLLRNHFENKDLEWLYRHLGPQNLLHVEAMFIDLEQELRATRLSQTGTSEDIEKSLEDILEASETSILDEIERMLDAREQKSAEKHQVDGYTFDEEAAILDNFQELAFQLRQKYSTVSDSTPLLSDDQIDLDSGEEEIPESVKDTFENVTTLTRSAERENEPEGGHVSEALDGSLDSSSEKSFEEDGGHFNKNKDIQGAFEDSAEIQRGPQAILESPVDMGFGLDVESPSSGSLDSPSTSDYHEEEQRSHAFGIDFFDFGNTVNLTQSYLDTYAERVIASLPEEWQPGPSFHGLPWQPVLATAMVGILTFLVFAWRTVLAVKSRTYQLTEKQLADRIKQLFDEKNNALSRISELKQKITENEEKLKESEKSASSSQRDNTELKNSFKELQKRSTQMRDKMSTLTTAVEVEKKRNQVQEEQIAQAEKMVKDFKRVVKSNKEELAKVQVLMDEAKIREDALKAQVMAFEKENNALKEQKKSLLSDAKSWEERHRDLGEKMKLFQKSQKELENSLAHKENEIEVLTDCIAELRQLDIGEATELEKGDTHVLANGDSSSPKSDALKSRIKQMMDVSRVKTALSIVEEEKNTYLDKLLNAEKQRQELEEQTKKLEHEQASLAGEKQQMEEELRTLQQKLEIMSELHQQKEEALQQKLTQEEFQRREKESMLSQVDGRALQAVEELKTYKMRVQEVEEELQKTERSYKAQISAHEKKAHDNWLNARASERSLVEEKRETANLRQKLVEVHDKLAEFQRPLIKAPSGRLDQQMPPLRRGDSYGPSPVSGGVPSPPLMIEGPGRPPSAPVGPRGDPFGPRPDSHGRYPDLGHPMPARPAPRTSSPSMDGSVGSRSQGHPSFMESPIRDSPVPGPHPKGHGPPNGPLPPMLRPPNGHLPMIPPGPPLPPMGPGPYGLPGPPRHYGPLPPFVRGPPPPMRDFPMGPPPFGPRDVYPEMWRPMAGPRDYPPPHRPLLPGPVPPPSLPPQQVTTGPRDFPEGPHPGPSISKDYPAQQEGHRDRSVTPQSGP
ncbi:transport and Golgi organization protein 1 homolog isoform X2 [Paramormyrops kingsleyae]|uniref:Transport and Golgi organization protein 1 homolog n=1 Tax=Paramormyrops kingsleyae TaxID=1676925 RepID=A0A3B3R9E9_9TELE|nr:transport and Golgi organization protein 1 homolog isoform X2 [Paramormyrops kingsleyae]